MSEPSGGPGRSGLPRREVAALGAILLVSVLLLSLAASSLLAQPKEAVDSCRAQLLESPEQLASYRCFWTITRRGEGHEEASAALLELLEASPSDPRPLLYLAMIRNERGDPEAPAMLEASADSFHYHDQPTGEVYARLALAYWFNSRDRIREGVMEIERAAVAAAGTSELEARVDFASAWLAIQLGDFARAEERFERTEKLVFPDGPWDLRQGAVSGLGYVAWSTGRYRAAAAFYRRLAEIAAAQGDRLAEASARYNQALMAERLATEEQDQPGAVVYQQAVEAAQRVGNLDLEARARLLLAQALVGEASLDNLQRALEIGSELQYPEIILQASRWLGRRMAEQSEDPEPGLDQIRESIRMARELGSHDAYLRGTLSLANTLWNVGREREAVAAWYETLDRVEELGRRQGRDEESARVASKFAFAYYQLAGRLLGRAPSSADSNPVESALAVVERLRVESLRSEAEGSGADVSDLGGAILEMPSLELVQAALEPEEALLSFQVSNRRGLAGQWLGGSWLVVLSREGVGVYPLVDESKLEIAVELLVGSLRGPELPHHEAVAGARALFDQVFGSALDQLPASVTKLLVVPDGVLHTLPFAVLDPPGTERFLVERYSVDTLPSLTDWYRWRTGRTEAGAAVVFALADPAIEDRSAEEWGLELAELPAARQEARAVARRLGGESRVLVDRQATKGSLVRLKPGDYSVIHLASHAVVDSDEPERTSLVLAAENGGHDGRLTIPEIADLRLDGALVVLATCRSAAGVVLHGKGVLGPTRAFLMAGARGVLGTLWPVEDDRIRKLIEAFYDRLALGGSVAQSLAGAQRDAISDGVSPSAWASVVVVGDGSLRFLPVEQKARRGWLVAGLGVLVALVGWRGFRARRAARGAGVSGSGSRR